MDTLQIRGKDCLEYYSPTDRRMIIYIVDPIKRTTGGEIGKGRKEASGWTASESEEGKKRTSEEGDRVKDKDEVSIDSVVRPACLGVPVDSAAFRVSTYG
jgi:hypothetical protein